jgi:hypothetical protein
MTGSFDNDQRIRDYLRSSPRVGPSSMPADVAAELESLETAQIEIAERLGSLTLDGEVGDMLLPEVLLEMSVPADVQNMLESLEALFVENDPPEEEYGAFVGSGNGNDDLDGGGGPDLVASLV